MLYRHPENNLYLELLGYTVVHQYECQCYKAQKNDPRVKSTQSQWRIPIPDTSILMNKEDIISGMKNGTIYGMVLIDIHSPEELEADFQETTPIFKNNMVSRNDIV